MTTTPAPAAYHVRAKVSTEVQQELLLIQAQRQLNGDGRISLMDLAGEWLEEMAQQKRLARQ